MTKSINHLTSGNKDQYSAQHEEDIPDPHGREIDHRSSCALATAGAFVAGKPKCR